MTILRPVFGLMAAATLITACYNPPAEEVKPAAKTSSKVEVYNADAIPHAQLGSNVTPTEYRLDMTMNPDDAGFRGIVEIDVSVDKPTSKIWIHGKTMTVTDAVAVLPGETSVPLTFTELPASEAPSGVAYLTSETPLPSGALTLRLPYETPYNLSLNSAYKVEQGGEAYIVTQFEPLGAREAFPSFDEPRFKVPFTLTITAPKDDFVYANTPEVSAEPLLDGWVKHSFAKSPPLPTYLIAFGAGPYDVVEYTDLPATDIRDRTVPLRGITAKGKASRINYGLKNTAGILEAIEGYFGIPYPYKKLDIIAAPEYAFGAMENPGAIVYREYLMLLDDDSPLSQKRAYAGVHSHEIAHQWFGNLVTPVWWEDIWLNEAFATWMGNKGTTIWNPDGNYDRNTLNSALGAMNIDTLATTRKVREPLERSEGVMDQFDGITYRKGGGVLSMFESYLGEGKFQDGVRLHMKRYADDVATGDDFFQSIADGSGDVGVVAAMKSFVDQPGLPMVSAVQHCETDGVEIEGLTELDLTQLRYAPLGSKTEQGQLWQIPLCAKFGYGDETVKQCILMQDKKATIIPNHESGKCADWVTLNENGSGYYRFSLDDEGWNALLSNIEHLNTREVLTVQDSLEAAFRAGNVSSEVYMLGMTTFADHPEYDVANKAGNYLTWFHDRLPESARPDVARLVKDMYAERYKQSVGADTVDGNLLAPTLARHLIFRAGDMDLLREFGRKGIDYLGTSEGGVDKSVLAPNMLGTALRSAMQMKPQTVSGPLLAMVKDGSSFEKGAAIGALSVTPDADMAAVLRKAALNDTDGFTGRQANDLIAAMLDNPDHRDSTWDWFKINFDEFVDKRVPDVRKGGMPGAAAGFCSLERRDEAKAFFESKAAVIPGSERSLAQTLESIELCAALKEAKSDELIKALAERE